MKLAAGTLFIVLLLVACLESLQFPLEAFIEEIAPISKPDILIACVGGGSNAIGLFHPFLNHNVEMFLMRSDNQWVNNNQDDKELNSSDWIKEYDNTSFLKATFINKEVF